MVQINFAQKSVTVKVVYYGPGMSGKTTNLEVVHQRAPEASRGDLTSISTDGDRTLFFDFMPLDLGNVAGMRTQFQIYTVPGQVYYNSTRKLVLQGVDGVVFVADSSASMVEENLESLRNLEENLAEYGKSLHEIPIILQYNKRDLPDALPVEELDRILNTMSAPAYEAVANTGQGVFPTLKALAARVLDSIHRQAGTANGGSAPASKPQRQPQQQQQAQPQQQQQAQATAAQPPPQHAPQPPQPAAAQPAESAAEPPSAMPAAPPQQQAPITAAATGFYQSPAQQGGAAPPVQSAGTGFYPAPGSPQQGGQPQQQQQIPLEQPPGLASGSGVGGFPQPASPPPQLGAQALGQTGFQQQPGVGQSPPGQLQQTGFHSPTQQHQTGFHQPQSAANLRMAGGSSEGMGSPAPPSAAGGSFQHQAPGAARSVSPQAPSPRIKPRGNAAATPTPSDSKSTLTTVAFMVVALAAGVVIGGLAFGLF